MSDSPVCCPGLALFRKFGMSIILVAVGAVGTWTLMKAQNRAVGQDAKKEPRLFEMRTYITHDGRLNALHARFRDHTTKLFEKHGMTNIGYWVPSEGDDAKNTLVYLLAYPDREARDASWKAFIADPEWKKAQAASEKDGPIVKEVKVQFLNPTDYSEIK